MAIARRLTREEFTELSASLPTEAACLNPGCDQRVSYRMGTQGRQRLFCGSPCRLTYGRRRRFLLEQLATLQWNLDYLDLPIATAHLNQLIRRVSWELARYGGVDHEAVDALLPHEPRIPLAVAMHNLTASGERADPDPDVLVAAQAHRFALEHFYDGRRRPSRWPRQP